MTGVAAVPFAGPIQERSADSLVRVFLGIISIRADKAVRMPLAPPSALPDFLGNFVATFVGECAVDKVSDNVSDKGNLSEGGAKLMELSALLCIDRCLNLPSHRSAFRTLNFEL
jgi:hypothetical protein